MSSGEVISNFRGGLRSANLRVYPIPEVELSLHPSPPSSKSSPESLFSLPFFVLNSDISTSPSCLPRTLLSPPCKSEDANVDGKDDASPLQPSYWKTESVPPTPTSTTPIPPPTIIVKANPDAASTYVTFQ